MGEFSGDFADSGVTKNIDMGGTSGDEDFKGYETDVKDCFAPDVVKQGTDEFPCFDVSSDEFYQNMEGGRRRIRFKKDTPVQKYMSGTKYNRSFFIRTTDSNGKQFVRKVK